MAGRKVRSLLKAGAWVYVISKVLSPALARLKKKQNLLFLKSGYQKRHLRDTFLVIAATDDYKVNSQIARDARELGILTNVVDAPGLSNFIVPSNIYKGDLIISISTSGKAPVLSKRIRRDLSKLLIPQYAKFLKTLKVIRQDLKLRCAKPNLRRQLLHCLVNAKMPPGYTKKTPRGVNFLL